MLTFFKTRTEQFEMNQLDSLMKEFETLKDKVASYRDKIAAEHTLNIGHIAALESNNEVLSAKSSKAYNLLLKIEELLK